MCKLCNKEHRVPLKYNYLKTQKTRYIANVIRDYINEYPCSDCLHLAVQSKVRQVKGLDYYIIFNKIIPKGVKKYGNSGASKVCRILHEFKQKHKPASKRAKQLNVEYQKTSKVITTIEPYISHIVNVKTKVEGFQFRITRSKKRKTKHFKTLKEAQDFKQRILNEYK